jgi:hypothetical protein
MNATDFVEKFEPKISSTWQKISSLFQRVTTIQNVLPFYYGQNAPEIVITKPLEKLIHTIDALDLHRVLPADSQFLGRKRSDRLTLAHCFVAKCILNIATTKALIERLHIDASLRRIVGYESRKDVPNESTFSRAFNEFSNIEIFQNAHAAIIKEYLGDVLLDNVSRDSTAIEGREKPDEERMKQLKVEKAEKKKKEAEKKKLAEEKKKLAAEKKEKRGKKLGRSRKKSEIEAEVPTEASVESPAEVPVKDPEKGVEKAPNVIEEQRHRSLKENLENLPTVCDVGAKSNAQGFKNSWIGYKLHFDTTSFGVPISAILTSASVHDSQVAIPLTQMSKIRVTNLYDLMDAGYCSDSLRDYSREQGHVPLIDHNARRGEKREFLDFEAERYKGRSVSERSNARLKDEFGGRNIRVKGAVKVSCHLMIGIVCLAVDTLLRIGS